MYTAWLHGRPVSSWADYLPTIAGISDDVLIDTAARWIQPQQASVVAVGPRDSAQRALELLGTPELRSPDDRGFESAV
jgi:predicted Zn-dependent peptidase